MSYVDIPNPLSPSIEIKFPEGFFDFDSIDEKLPDALFEAGMEARTFWKSEAGRRLSSTRERYQESIELRVPVRGDISLFINDSFILDVEMGRRPYSLRPFFLDSPMMRNGPVKIPTSMAPFIKKTGQPKATRWMIVPLNVNREPVGRFDPIPNPEFRIFTDTQPESKWQHPGFPGVNIHEDVAKELADNILPKHLDAMLEELFGD